MTATEPCRVVIADDHPLVRGALRQAVLHCVPGAAIVEADSHDAVLARLAGTEGEADLVLLDLAMPGLPGFAGLFALRGQYPAVPVIVVSAVEDPATIFRAIDYGAAGFIPKSADLPVIAEAIGAVLAGGIWIPPGLTRPAGQPAEEAAAFAGRIATLTPQQLLVLAMLRAGKPNKVIAYELGNSEATVKTHVTAILRKLGVTSRTQAVILAAGLDTLPGVEALVES